MDDHHFRLVANYVLKGKVVPFLGAGVAFIGRSEDDRFHPGTRLPSGGELAAHLAGVTELTNPSTDLARVSQALAMLTGAAGLYDELRAVFDHDYPPTSLHLLLAELPDLMRRAGSGTCPFIVTTNYDDIIERAFEAADEPYDLVVYIADGPDRGKFRHRDHRGEWTVVDEPNTYDALALTERPVVAKIHGAIHRTDSEWDSYVITEDHYIDYLTRTEISSLIPVKLVAQIRKSHFLFLGYSLKDWNLRVILHRIWGSQKLHYKSWSVQHKIDAIEQHSWAQRDVLLFEMPLEEYLERLRAALHSEVATL